MSASNLKKENIVWSDKDFKLCDFVEIYPPPQIVQVEEGYMDSEEEERTLSASQVLTLHIIKDFKTVQGFDQRNVKISLPVNSTAKLEILSQQPSIYENVEELAKDFPKYVASMEKHPWLKIEENDVLELKSIEKSFRSNSLVCLNVTKGSSCEIPLDYKARFKWLGDCSTIQPTMNDIVACCKLPIYVKYIDDELKVIHEGLNANLPFGMNMLGRIKLQSVTVNKVLLITTWEDDKVVSLPLDLDIRVVAALGALRNDHNYAKLCKIAHSKTKVEDLELMFIKEGSYKVLLVEHNREILTQKEDDSDDDRGAYCDIAPRVPSRSLKPNVRGDNSAYRRPPFRKSTSLHLPRSNYPEEVFGEKGVRSCDDSGTTGFSPVKKVFRGIKKKASNAKKGIFTNFHKKSESEDYEEYDNELSPKSSHTTSGHVTTTSHDTDRHLLTGHERSSHATSGHELSGHAMSGHVYEPGYREIRPLPSNIQADRINETFVQSKMLKRTASVCKIRNPENIRTWSIEEVTECLRYCHLDKYIGVFQKEMVDGSLLADLDEDALRSIGVNDKLHLTKMMKIIQDGWLPKH